jgi:hypothetical protein
MTITMFSSSWLKFSACHYMCTVRVVICVQCATYVYSACRYLCTVRVVICVQCVSLYSTCTNIHT